MHQDHRPGLDLRLRSSSGVSTFAGRSACSQPPAQSGDESASLALRPLQPPYDVDALFRDMDALARESPERDEALRERGRRVLVQAREAVNLAYRHNFPLHPFLVESRHCALEQAVRDILAGRSHTVPQDLAAATESDPAARIAAGVERAQFSEEYFRITEAMNAKVSNAARVAEAVSKDGLLSAMLLRLVNSPFYGLGSHVDTLQRAVAFTGFNELSALALAVSAVRHFRSDEDGGSVPAGFWRRSIICGVLAKLLARRAGLSGEWFFVAGLLHDMGGITARRAVPVLFGQLAETIRRGDAHPEKAEALLLGRSTADIGASLLRRWGMVEELAGLVENRRAPGRVGYEPGVCVLHLAEILATAMTVALPETMALPRLDPLALEALGLAPCEPAGLLEQAVEDAAGVLGALFS